MKKKYSPHMQALISLVIKTSEYFANKHGLRWKKFDCSLKRKNYSGLCDYDGTITYRLSGKEPYQVLDLVAHERAHLAHFNHDEKWMRLHAELLCDMLSEGVLQNIKEVCPILPE